MIARCAFNASLKRAAELLIVRGFEPVESCFISRSIPLHLIGLRDNCELLCVKLRMVYGSVSERYVESFCRFEICQFRSLLTSYPGDFQIHCEVWVVSPNRSIHCYEIFPYEIRKVAAYVR